MYVWRKRKKLIIIKKQSFLKIYFLTSSIKKTFCLFSTYKNPYKNPK